MSENDAIHFDRFNQKNDKPSLQNIGHDQRFLNHLFLSNHFPAFFPQLIIPDDTIAALSREKKGYPVEKIEGIVWMDSSFEMSTQLEIVEEILSQLQVIFDQTGIVLVDRGTPGNILINSNNRPIQADTEMVYDARAGQLGEVDLRKRHKPIKNYAETYTHICYLVYRIFTILTYLISDEMTESLAQEIDEYLGGLNMRIIEANKLSASIRRAITVKPKIDEFEKAIDFVGELRQKVRASQ